MIYCKSISILSFWVCVISECIDGTIKRDLYMYVTQESLFEGMEQFERAAIGCKLAQNSIEMKYRCLEMA